MNQTRLSAYNILVQHLSRVNDVHHYLLMCTFVIYYYSFIWIVVWRFSFIFVSSTLLSHWPLSVSPTCWKRDMLRPFPKSIFFWIFWIFCTVDRNGKLSSQPHLHFLPYIGTLYQSLGWDHMTSLGFHCQDLVMDMPLQSLFPTHI